LVIASLAKAFGAPLAILAGSRALVASFEAQSETRVHSSPPSVADIHAAQRALAVNAVAGDELRFQLAQRVHHFHRRLTAAGLDAGSGIFPVRTVRLPTAVPVKEVHAHLLRRGIRTVLRRAQGAGEPRLSLIITVRHRADEIDHAVEVLAQTARMLRMPALEGP
jgi:8-amino-7-oxononanoate synthase